MSNESIKAAFNRMWQHTVNAIGDIIENGIFGTVEVTSGTPESSNTVLTIDPDAETINIYTADEIDNKFDEFSQEKVDKSNVTLDKHTDGLIYIFVDGKPVGNGVEVTGEVVEGDVIGTLDENNNIILSGDIPDGTYTLKYLNEDGTYTEVGSIVVGAIEEPEPTYTNLIPLSTDASGNPFVGTNGEKGYKTGYRISASSGNESATASIECTGFIPVGYDDTLYFKGIEFGNDTYSNYALYDSSKTYIAGGNWANEFGGQVLGDAMEIEVASLKNTVGTIDSSVAYIRFSAFVIDENSICTVNEPIE